MTRLDVYQLIRERNVAPLLELSENELKEILDRNRIGLLEAIDADFYPVVELYQKYDTNWSLNIKNVFNGVCRPDLGQKMYDLCPEDQKQDVLLRILNYPVKYLQCHEKAKEFLEKNMFQMRSMRPEWLKDNKGHGHYGDCVVGITIVRKASDVISE